MSINIIIILITCAISIIAFSKQEIIDKAIFSPTQVTYKKEFYRFISCGFIHADVPHLAFNMFSLYSLGKNLETAFCESFFFGSYGKMVYLLLYISALIVSILPTYLKHKTNDSYASLGASGAVSAIVFGFILLFPTAELRLVILPIPAPAYIFGLVYLVITYFLDKRGGGRINHSAHLWGSLYGIGFIIVACALFSSYKPLQAFVDQVF